jgi:hypothetical protein
MDLVHGCSVSRWKPETFFQRTGPPTFEQARKGQLVTRWKTPEGPAPPQGGNAEVSTGGYSEALAFGRSAWEEGLRSLSLRSQGKALKRI